MARGDIIQQVTTENFNKRFWSKVNKDGPSGKTTAGRNNPCWVWTAKLNDGGYGRIRIQRGQPMILAHRASYIMHSGEIPDGQLVQHSCDNRCCVNPDHLSVGSNQDNTSDAVERGRWRGRSKTRPHRTNSLKIERTEQLAAASWITLTGVKKSGESVRIKDVHLEERFWSKIDKSGDDKKSHCWIWTGYTTVNRGILRIDGKHCLSSRISFILKYGSITPGLIILHSCDNPSCVNPDHLKEGTAKDNAIDMVKKDRNYIGNIGGRGEDHNGAKLTWKRVEKIRNTYSTGEHTQRELGEMFGVTQTNISSIVHNNSWKIGDNPCAATI